MIKTKIPLVGGIRGPTAKQSANTGVGNGAPEKVASELKADTCTAGYQPVTGSLCLRRMGVGEGAPEKVTPELETDTCTAGYQPTTESSCLERIDVGIGAPEKVTPELKTDTCKNMYPGIVNGHIE